MKEFKHICVIIGTMIGAGFVTGKEISVYFAQYGILSLFFLIPLFFVFYSFIYLLLKHLKSNSSLLNKKYFKIILLIINLIISASMFSACKQLINFEINSLIIDLILIIFFYLLLKKGYFLIEKTNKLITPILVVIFLSVCFLNLKGNDAFVKTIELSDVFAISLNSIIYPSMNIILSIYVLSNISKDIKIKSKTIALVSSFILCFMIGIGIIVIIKNPSVVSVEMPLVSLATKLGPVFYCIYNGIVLLGVITTLMITLYSINKSLDSIIKNTKWSIPLSILMTYILSIFGFEIIVSYFYAIVGYIGLFLILSILFSNKLFFKNTNKVIHKGGKYTNYNDASHY